MRKTFLILALCFTILLPWHVLAVPSPDLIINVGTIIAQWLGIGLVFVLGIFGTTSRFLRTLWSTSRWKFFGIVIGFPLIVASLVIVSVTYYQKQSEANLVRQLQERDASSDNVHSENDNLTFDSATITAPSDEKKFSSLIVTFDAGAQLIVRYYEDIALGRLDDAYEISHQKVSRTIFGTWYGRVTYISLAKLTKIDDTSYSLELVLCETGQLCGRYGVLMKLLQENGSYVRIADSQVRSLKLDSKKQELLQNKSLSLSNEEFQSLLNSGKIPNIIVLDAREDIEYQNGHFPGSMHIRIADLKAGKWIDLDTTKTIIVLCWSGIRGKEVAEFLRSKEIDAQYVVNGAQGWVKNGGLWKGSISIKEAYPEKQYSRLLTCDEIHEEMRNGASIIDSRGSDRYAQFHIPGSTSIAMLSVPSSELENTFAQIPPGARTITVCDGYVNCFDARVVGIELEKRGYTFLGRFTDLECFR